MIKDRLKSSISQKTSTKSKTPLVTTEDVDIKVSVLEKLGGTLITQHCIEFLFPYRKSDPLGFQENLQLRQ